MSDRTAGPTTFARRPSFASTNLTPQVMNRIMPVMNGVIAANEPMTPMKVWVGDPKNWTFRQVQFIFTCRAGEANRLDEMIPVRTASGSRLR
jgi:hypothetical protein